MVINLSSETPAKAINPMDSTKFIVVKNHVRERTSEDQYKSENKAKRNTSDELCEKKTKKRKKSADNLSLSSENSSDTLSEDLEELKAVYHKCKAIVAKIESKYGHLLNIDNIEQYRNKKDKLNQDSGCNCVLNKKIIFDDDGKQILENVQQHVPDIHICPERLHDKDHYQANKQVINVSRDDEDTTPILPDNLLELGEILKKSEISNSFRNNVIEKIKHIRHQNLDMMRFDKSSLIQKVKLSPNEVIQFKGANLSTLQGYPEPNL